jgi:hypothetical protein
VSGVCITAQRTSKNSATIGIFRIATNQMNVQAFTRAILYPAGHPYKPRKAILRDPRQAPHGMSRGV